MLCFENANQNHHIVPLSRGGLDNENNLILLCDDCHGQVGLHSRFEETELFLATKKHYFESRYLEQGKFWEHKTEPVIQKEEEINEVKIEYIPAYIPQKQRKILFLLSIRLKRKCLCGEYPFIRKFKGTLRIKCFCGLKTRSYFREWSAKNEWRKIQSNRA